MSPYSVALEMIKLGTWQIDPVLGEVYGSHREPLCPASKRRYRRAFVPFGTGRKEVLLHRLIFEYVHGEIPAGLQINHRDGNRHNNTLGNLELVTPQQNIQHAMELGLRPKRLEFCRKGLHRLEGKNIRIWTDGSRRCRECTNIGKRRRGQ